ncbi:hypothetical protein HELRODRAFT_179056 [Helobdella robusta]|uniref:Uncharacterized protein n=1 Tax=Helobdella robusta TaxID=6412 RepID=T1FE43_HELRO|nr:hypothetical protein HELRODRAFT_179056 [Helobdella robusta]ESN95863.1 hypothetical protein HELRODRAFT_179056 [Helobdella robusta]
MNEMCVSGADNTKLCAVVDNDKDIEIAIGQRIGRWCSTLTNNKCAVINMGANNKANVFKLGNTPLKNVEEEKDVGVIIHRNGKVAWQCIAAAKSADMTLGKINK